VSDLPYPPDDELRAEVERLTKRNAELVRDISALNGCWEKQVERLKAEPQPQRDDYDRLDTIGREVTAALVGVLELFDIEDYHHEDLKPHAAISRAESVGWTAPEGGE